MVVGLLKGLLVKCQPGGPGGGWAGSSLIIRQMVPLALNGALALSSSSEPWSQTSMAFCHLRDKPHQTMHLQTTLVPEAILSDGGSHLGSSGSPGSLPAH